MKYVSKNISLSEDGLNQFADAFQLKVKPKKSFGFISESKRLG
jgi:hypothetical protein